MIAVIDYGMGNLRSVQKSLEFVGAKVIVTHDPDLILNANSVVLPGVGAFKDCMANLKKLKLVDPIRKFIDSGKPFLGICLGLQVLFEESEGVEFDTLLFFFGVLTAVGALQYIGYLAIVSENMYGTLGPTISNVLVGVLSAIVDNIPVMFAVLKMEPIMDLDQWLLITLTTGTGGSLLSVGSAAGVAVMGVDRKNYTFISHLKWIPAIAAGYVASIGAWWLVTMGLR